MAKKESSPVADPSAEFEVLKADLAAANAKAERLVKFINIAIADSEAFINQCDREGLGMKTITDHRKRIEKFLKEYRK